ncbi:MAG: trigger factor [Candidatus Pacebacteria bacterium]|nr:trigger factor [Candidatus Paceibacterota bacterium]
MKIQINSLPKSKQEIIVSLNQKDLLPFKENALRELNKNLQINGYRPGTAPLTIAENYLDPFKVYEKMASLAIEKIYPEIIKEKNIQAIGYPSINITKIVPNQEVEFKAEVAVIPALKLPDYKGIAGKTPKKNKELKVREEEIEEALSWLQSSRANLKSVNRPAKIDDIVTIDYQIKESDKIINNGEDKNHSFVLGKGNFIPGFEDSLIGLKPGEKKEFELIVPSDWPQKDLQNKKLDIAVQLKEIKIKELPALNDDFAQNIGRFKNLEALKKSIKEGLLLEKQQRESERWRLEVLEKIAEKTNIEIPEILIQNEIGIMIEELKDQLERIQMPYEKYLEQIKKDEEDLKRGFGELARKRVVSSLILREIALLENIEIPEEEIQNKINEILKQIPEDEVKQKINPDDLKVFASGIIRNEKVFQILEEQSAPTD